MEKVSLSDLLKLDITGKIICFPTDTVYGVGAQVKDIDAIKKIYEMKNRDERKPLAILTASTDVSEYVDEVTSYAKKLIEEHWPGPLTLIFKKSKNIDDLITKGFNTVGLRMPNSKIALAILNHFGPMATTSVNLAGMPPLNSVEDIEKTFKDKIDYIVIDKEKISKKPSTIIDLTEDNLKVVR